MSVSESIATLYVDEEFFEVLSRVRENYEVW